MLSHLLAFYCGFVSGLMLAWAVLEIAIIANRKKGGRR